MEETESVVTIFLTRKLLAQMASLVNYTKSLREK